MKTKPRRRRPSQYEYEMLARILDFGLVFRQHRFTVRDWARAVAGGWCKEADIIYALERYGIRVLKQGEVNLLLVSNQSRLFRELFAEFKHPRCKRFPTLLRRVGGYSYGAMRFAGIAHRATALPWGLVEHAPGTNIVTSRSLPSERFAQFREQGHGAWFTTGGDDRAAAYPH